MKSPGHLARALPIDLVEFLLGHCFGFLAMRIEGLS